MVPILRLENSTAPRRKRPSRMLDRKVVGTWGRKMPRRKRDRRTAEDIITYVMQWATRQGFINIAGELRRALDELNQRPRS
jgi:hypothetical protein